jgi:hypothetical protein
MARRIFFFLPKDAWSEEFLTVGETGVKLTQLDNNER